MTLAYAATISGSLTEDSLWYARAALLPGWELFHPHHLLYNPLLRLLYLPLASVLRRPEHQLLFMQGLNILASAAAVGVFYLAARRAGAGGLRALTMAAFLGGSSGFYVFSSQIEVYGITCLFLCVSLWGLAGGADTRRNRLAIASGFGAAMLFHQTAIFFALAIVAHTLVAGGGRLRGSWSRLTSTILLPLAAVGAIYVAVGWSLGHQDPSSLWRWLITHATLGYWGAGDVSTGTLYTVLRTVRGFFFRAGGGPWWWTALFFRLLMLSLAAEILMGGRRAFRNPPLWTGAAVWMAALVVFSGWWDASGAEFTMVLLVPAWLIMALTLAPAGAPRATRRLRTLSALCLATCLALLAASDVLRHVRNLEPDEMREAARTLSSVARDGDFVLAVGTHQSAWYRIFLGERPVDIRAFNVKLALEAAGDPEPSSFTRRVIDALAEEIRAVHGRGGRCLVDRWILSGSFRTGRLLGDLEMPAFLAGLRERIAAEPVPGQPAVYFYEARERGPDLP